MSQPALELQQQLPQERGIALASMPPIGRIVSVTGPRAVAALDRAAQRMLHGEAPRVQIGALLKVTTPASSVIGLVTGVSTPMPATDDASEEIGLIEPNLSRVASPWHTDLDLSRPIEVMTDMAASRKRGFAEYQNTEEAFHDLFAELRADKIIP